MDHALVKEPMRIIGTRLVREMRDEERPTLQCPADVEEFLRAHLDKNLDREICGVICLAPSGQVSHAEVLSVGTEETTVAYPRGVFRAAILSAAVGVVLFHTHPTTTLKGPSVEDVALTYRMIKAADIMGLHLVDHLILTDEDSFSFRVAADVAKRDSIEELCLSILTDDDDGDNK